MHRVVTIGATAFVVLLTGSCESPASRSTSTSVPQPTGTTTPSPSSARDLLEFRQVLGSIPYKGASNSTCENGKKITPRRKGSATTEVVLADRKKTACYLLGSAVLTGRNIDAATAVIDLTTSSWVVNIRFTNDDFVEKVARPYVGKQIAIIFRDVVESAPTVNAGIVDRDVTISADFDEATARALARALS